MSLFKSKRGRRNIRKKAVELEEEGVEGEKEGTEATDVLATNGETRPPPSQTNISTAPTKKKEARSLLSFEDELADEGPEFRVKKTTLSRRAAKMAGKDRKEKKHKKKRET
ncbi:hypothetical protein GBAR_LOCUS10546 [Geodia barretti]|nr:hypothetical protein GBAR_LOCUS10546 [Geodia barretti]